MIVIPVEIAMVAAISSTLRKTLRPPTDWKACVGGVQIAVLLYPTQWSE